MNVHTEMNERDMAVLAIVARSATVREARQGWSRRNNELMDIIKKLQWYRLCLLGSDNTLRVTASGAKMLHDYSGASPYFRELKRVGVAVFVTLHRTFGQEPFSVMDAYEFWRDDSRIRTMLNAYSRLGWVQSQKQRHTPYYQFTVDALAPWWILSQDSLRPLITFPPPLHLHIKYALARTGVAMTVEEIAEVVQEASYVVRATLCTEVAAKESIIQKVSDASRVRFLVDPTVISNTQREQFKLHQLHLPDH